MEACKWYLAFHLRLNPRDVVLKLWITKNSRQSNWLGSVSTPPIMNFRSCFTKWFRRRCATIIVSCFIYTFSISFSSIYTLVLEWLLYLVMLTIDELLFHNCLKLHILIWCITLKERHLLLLSLMRYSKMTIELMICNLLWTIIWVTNRARNELTRLRYKWTRKWKGKGVDETL